MFFLIPILCHGFCWYSAWNLIILCLSVFKGVGLGFGEIERSGVRVGEGSEPGRKVDFLLSWLMSLAHEAAYCWCTCEEYQHINTQLGIKFPKGCIFPTQFSLNSEKLLLNWCDTAACNSYTILPQEYMWLCCAPFSDWQTNAPLCRLHSSRRGKQASAGWGLKNPHCNQLITY